MTGTTRGRLPARVYWVRRLMVLGTAALLVIGIARMLGSSSDGSSGPDQAKQVADVSTPTTGPTTSAPTRTGHQHHHRVHHTSPPAEPSGPCAADDIAITPSVPHPIAGSDISLVLDLSTISSPACDWTLSGKTLALKITSGSDLIWTTVQCARSIPTQSLVLRNTDETRAKITWNARRSEPGCPRLTDWARLGTYHLRVAALAGQPQDVTFLLVAPTPAEITQTAHPHQSGRHDGKGKGKGD